MPSLILLIDGIVLGKLLLLTGVAIIGLGIFWYSRIANEKAMQKLGELLQLDVIRIDDGVFDNEGIKLRGLINSYDVGVVNTPRYKRPHEIIIRIYLKRKNLSHFKLTISRGLQGIVDSIMGTDYTLGHDQFDKHFTVITKDIQFIHLLIDAELAADFASNHETFRKSTIVLHDEYLELREDGKVTKPVHVDRLKEIVPFLLHIAERIDKLNSKHQ